MEEKWENERKERIMLEKERKEKEKKDTTAFFFFSFVTLIFSTKF